MAAALIGVCVDPRLNHEIIRLQVRQRLERSGLRAERIYILNEQGGNLGTSFRNTAQLLARAGEPIVFCAVLHHDDCLAAQEGQRTDLATTAKEMATELERLGVTCPVVTGQIRTAHSQLLWTDEPAYRYVPFSFGAGQ
jgi:hypothetical protein